MYTCLQCQARLTTCDPLQHSRMWSYHRHSCVWSSSSDQVCPHSALTWKLSDDQLCSFATPGEHGATRCMLTWSVARVYNHPCRESWNYKIHQHTYCRYSPDDKIWCRYTAGLLPPGSKVDASHSLSASDSLCVGLGPRRPPSTCSATGRRYSLSARKESMNSKCSAADPKWWRS